MNTSIKGLMLAVALLLLGGGCRPKSQPLDPGAMLYVNVTSTMTTKAVTEGEAPSEEHLCTPREVVERAQNFCFDLDAEHNPFGDGAVPNALTGIGDEMKDYEHNRIKMWGAQIIDDDGTLRDYFMACRNVRICSGQYPDDDKNILAYIPNRVMEEGWKKIQAAYNAGNYDEVYRLFQEVYTAIPITPSEYAKLREKGEN